MSLYGRIYAVMYNQGIGRSERAGLADWTRDVLSGARGRVLEIGAGTGRNLRHYPPDGISELVLTEPDPDMARLLERRLGDEQRAARVVTAPAEALPFEDASFDTVVCTLVLCSVPEPDAALGEVRRVLRPAGRLLLIEHVRSPSERLARWQDRLAPLWRVMNRGCSCNRDTLAALERRGFDTGELEWQSMPKQPPIVRPLVVGPAGAPQRG